MNHHHQEGRHGRSRKWYRDHVDRREGSGTPGFVNVGMIKLERNNVVSVGGNFGLSRLEWLIGNFVEAIIIRDP